MPTGILTAVNLVIALASVGLGIAKAVAARKQREITLTLTASVLIVAGLIFLLATPFVFRAVGALLHSPNLCALLVPAFTLICVAHAHAMSQLWQPEQPTPAALRRTAWRWGPVYGGAITAMTVLYFRADLGDAAPLRFAAAYAHVPEVRWFHVVYWATLITTVVVTVRECRSLSIPGRPELVENVRNVLGWFAIALGLDLVNVVLTAIAMVGSATGPRRLDTVAQSAWLATIASCIAANIALAALVLRSRRAERRDVRALKALRNVVVDVERDDRMILAPRFSLWTGFDTGLELTSIMAEIHDGAGRLSPWWSRLPSLAVDRLAQDQDLDSASGSESRDSDWDLTAALAAATLLHAAQARKDPSAPAVPEEMRLPMLPGTHIEPADDRRHLVLVAQHLDNPLVLEAVELARAAHAATVKP